MGITHQWEEVVLNDAIRTKRLEEIGFSVLRFADDLVLTDINGAYNVMVNYIEKFEVDFPPSLILPPVGDIGAYSKMSNQWFCSHVSIMLSPS